MIRTKTLPKQLPKGKKASKKLVASPKQAVIEPYDIWDFHVRHFGITEVLFNPLYQG